MNYYKPEIIEVECCVNCKASVSKKIFDTWNCDVYQLNCELWSCTIKPDNKCEAYIHE